jgi:hypothetical protein
MLDTPADRSPLSRSAPDGASRMAGMRGLVIGCFGSFGAGRHSLLQVGISRRTFVYVGASLTPDLSATSRRPDCMPIAHPAGWLSRPEVSIRSSLGRIGKQGFGAACLVIVLAFDVRAMVGSFQNRRQEGSRLIGNLLKSQKHDRLACLAAGTGRVADCRRNR